MVHGMNGSARLPGNPARPSPGKAKRPSDASIRLSTGTSSGAMDVPVPTSIDASKKKPQRKKRPSTTHLPTNNNNNNKKDDAQMGELQTNLSELLQRDEDGFLDLIAAVVKGKGNKQNTSSRSLRGSTSSQKSSTRSLKRNSTTSSARLYAANHDYVTREEMEDLLDERLESSNGTGRTVLMNDNVNSPFGDLDPEESMGLMKVDEEDDDMHVPFGDSSYTMLFLHRLLTQAFWYSIFVYILQIATIALTLIDVIDIGRDSNPLQIPPMVGTAVTAAQAVALFLLAAYASDLIEAVLKIQDGYYPEVLPDYPGATMASWAFSCATQLFAGLLLLVTSFVLTISVDTVIDVMLNLTALLFMSEIDDLGFAMAKMGFITDRLQQEAFHVSDVRLPKRKRRNIWRRALYLLALGGVFTGYGILKRRQLNGYYLPTYLYIQFGDGSNFKIPYYSGVLTSGPMRTAGYREYRDLGTSNILLAYCGSARAWTFSETDDPCDFFARSPETSGYDVTEIPSSEWEVVNSISRLEPFDTFSLVGIDCDPSICQGECVDGLCECPIDQDRFGLDCGFTNVCPELAIHEETQPFPIRTFNKSLGADEAFSDIQNFPISEYFYLLRDETTGEYARAYNMPVFYSNKTYPANIILFGGLRWIITSELDLIDLAAAEKEYPNRKFFPEKTISTLNNGFHAYYRASYTTFFMSDQMDFATPEFAATPAGLGWWSVGILDAAVRHYAPDLPLETRLVCDGCKPELENGCGAGGFCNATSRVCECKPGWIGDECETRQSCDEMENPCGGNGVCNPRSGNCRCNAPFYGKICELQYQCFEELGSCRNGGSCDVESGVCDCEDPATSGSSCELHQDCHVRGCENGGLCSPTGFCECRPPFYGALCQLVDKTAPNELFCTIEWDCLDGDCNLEKGICECKDPSKFGSLCQHTYDCTSSDLLICANGGVCNRDNGLCECPEPYYGPNCSRRPLCVSDSQCEEGDGYCDVVTGDCYPKGSCEKNGCNNHGDCNEKTGNCECTPPWSGAYCEGVISQVEESPVFQEFKLQIERCGFPPYPPGSDAAEMGCAANMTQEYWDSFNEDG